MNRTPNQVALENNFDLLDLMPVGALVLKSDLTVIFWNKLLEDWTNIPRDKIVGNKITDIVLHFADSIYSRRLESVFGAGLPIIFSSQLHKCVIPVRQKNGEFRIQHTIVTPIKSPGKGYYALFTIQDVTELNNRIDDFKKVRDKALKEIEERRKVENKLRQAKSKAEDMEEKFRQLSMLDGLTGLANRRHFDAVYENEWKRALRDKHPISLVMIDIDFFKAYNDNYGHLKGDKCLTKVGKALKLGVKRPGDFVARFGGEEFVVILPSTNEKSAFELAEDMRKNIEELKIARKKTDVNDYVTISAGVACIVPLKDIHPTSLIQSADEALYRAKAAGRNKVEIDNMCCDDDEK